MSLREIKIETYLVEWIFNNRTKYAMWKSGVERNCLIREIAAGLLQYDNVYATEATIRIKIQELENGFKKALDAYNLIQPFSTDPYQLNKSAEDRFKFRDFI